MTAMEPGALHDTFAGAPVVESTTLHRGRVWNILRDSVRLADDQVHDREYSEHLGSVAVIALDDDGRVLVQRQYRHPVRGYLWEPPAGLLDEPGECPWQAAQRELAEEADLQANTWHTLVDFYNSPGNTNQAMRIYLARDMSPCTDHGFTRTGEEADMRHEWVALSDVVSQALAGQIGNVSLVLGVLALAAAQSTNFATLRTPDAPWHAHPRFRGDATKP